MMKPRRIQLAREPRPAERVRAQALGDLPGGEAVPVRRERFYGGFGLVGRGQPARGVAVGFDFGDLGGEGFGPEEVDAVADVFEIGDCADEARGGGEEV